MIEKLKAALEALEAEQPLHAMEDLRCVIAEMEAGEPVMEIGENESLMCRTLPLGTKLYTHPQPKAEPVPFPEADLNGVSVCCGEYAKCGRPCTPRGRWLAQNEPKAEPTKCVKCGDELMSSFTNTCYTCKQKADRAPCRITTDGMCVAMECFEDAQPKKPLSVLQIRDIRDIFDKDEPISLVAFARAIETAHGIK